MLAGSDGYLTELQTVIPALSIGDTLGAKGDTMELTGPTGPIKGNTGA